MISKKITLTDRLRRLFGGLIQKTASFLVSFGIRANHITILGFTGNALAAGLIANGNHLVGGVIAGFNCLLDSIDGAIAAESNSSSQYGSFLDSTLDRYSEFVLYLGLTIHFLIQDNRVGVLLSFLSFGGSLLVSYIRAKGEGLGIVVKQGILTRVERLFILIISLVAGLPSLGLLLIAVLANITALQRFWISRKMLIGKEHIQK